MHHYPPHKQSPKSPVLGWLLLLIFGALVLYAGIAFYRIHHGLGAEPVPVAVADLEAGGVAPDRHVLLGPHVRMYSWGSMVVETIRTFDGRGYHDGSAVERFYFPIASEALFARIERDSSQNGISLRSARIEFLQPVTKAQVVSRTGAFKVLGRTKRYKTVRELPYTDRWAEAQRGILFQDFAGLDAEDKRFLREAFPTVDPDTLLILDLDLEPMGMGWPYGLMALGALMVLASLRPLARTLPKALDPTPYGFR